MRRELEIKKVLQLLEESVNREEKEKLNESALLHVALEVWENLYHTSHQWHTSPGALLRAVAISLFGIWVASLDWNKIWNKIKEFSLDKIRKFLKAAQLINASNNSMLAIEALKQKLGLDVKPNLERVMYALA